MATPSSAFPYSPTPQDSAAFPSDTRSTPPPSTVPSASDSRRQSVKQAPEAAYPSPPSTSAPFPSVSATQAAPPATTRSTRPAYDPSLVIPPFNPNKRKSTSSAAPSSSSSRRNSAQVETSAAQMSATQLYQQQQYYLQQQQQQQHQQPHQRPVSVMPGYPSHPHTNYAYPSSAFTPSSSVAPSPVPTPAPVQGGPGGSVSSRSRQSVGYLPTSPSTAQSFAGQGPYPHLYTPHPMPRQKVYFGPYILLQTLGEGEFGKVKLGVHAERWGEDVAIKLIKRGNVDTVQRGEKVRREIEVLKMVRHPNIVRLYDVIETEKYIGIVLEYASGGELFDHILAHRYLKERDASRLFAQLISGVGYLHSKGVVHRDLKLENLLLDRNRNVIITDFGFANRFNDAHVDLMATSCGSPCYAAPELVVSDGKYVGTAVDVWSCGVILYAMLAGYLPYDDDPANPEGDNINLLYKYILSTPLTFPDWITDEPRDLLLTMLVPDPTKRCTIHDVMRHPWLRRYAPAFEKTVDELEFQAQELERHKRQALEVQRQWLIQQQKQAALAAQGLLAPSMTRSQTATTSMGGVAAFNPSASTPASASMAAAVAQQRHRSAMVTSASTTAVTAPPSQHGFEHYSMASSPMSPSLSQPATPTVLEEPTSPRSRTTSTSSASRRPIPVPSSSNPNRRSGQYTISSTPPTTQTEFVAANAGPFSFESTRTNASLPTSASVPMVPSLSAPAAAQSLAAIPHVASEDTVMADGTPSPAASAGPSRRESSTEETIDEMAARRWKAAHRATVQVEYDPAASTRRRGASKEPSLSTPFEGVAVDGLGIATAAEAEASAVSEEGLLEVPSTLSRGAPSPTPSTSAVSVSTTTETSPGEDVVMQSVEEVTEPIEVPDSSKDASLPPPVPASEETAVTAPTASTVPFPSETPSAGPSSPTEPASPPTTSNGFLAAMPRKRKSSGSPASSLNPDPAPALPQPPTVAEEAAKASQPKTSTSSQASQPPRPPSAASSRHRHAPSVDRFSLRSFLGGANQANDKSGRVPPVPAKDSPLDEVTNRRKSTRRQKALSLQPFRHSVSSKLPKQARANVEAASVMASRDRSSTVAGSSSTQDGMPPPLPKPQEALQQVQASPAWVRQGRTQKLSDGASSAMGSKRLSADLEANWQGSSSSVPPSGKAKAVMDWFRRKSTRNEPSGQMLAPIKTDFDDRRKRPLSTATEVTEGVASSNVSMRDAASTPIPAERPPSVVITQPVVSAPPAEPSLTQSQISHRTASTLSSSIAHAPTAAAPPPRPSQPAQQQSIAPPAFVASKLRFHQGALDKNAITYRSPDEVIAEIKQALWNMGVDMAAEGEYKIKCVRKSRKKAMATSAIQRSASSSNVNALDRRLSLTNAPGLPQSPSMGFRSIFGKKSHANTPLHSPSLAPSPTLTMPGTPTASTQEHFDPLSSPMTTSVSQFSMLSLSSPQPLPVYGGEKSADAGDEVRFVVEMTRVRNLDKLYCVDVKRMKGGPWSYKHVYDQLLGALELGPVV
ncbi:CAMK/CAMKL/Kin4 protein kinase [Rhodotorula toruloides ATCC 204091]|uniref:non-specific serine/threonine protein kinase n=1 Tax=Rhodotorula toruloides TaxID=5286 RepID=A0A0K3CNL3_RHOTO|nr:CAMK/CAMKL/Kin4 protein kinase [Rhodotorula toruloides ATCC 204091]PRQ71201.1 CAMK/CAMKL/Kin4 protein kinase [Rhodotorula toruloides]